MRIHFFIILLMSVALKVEAQDMKKLEVINVGNVDHVQQVSEFNPDGSDLIGELTPEIQNFAEEPAGEQHWQTSVDFSPDGRLLVAGSYDTSVRIWDMDSGNRYLTLLGHRELVNDVAFSPDGTLIASCSGAYQWYQDFSVRLWDSQTGELFHSLIGHTDQVMDVAFSRDGTQIASASFDGTVRVWDVATGKEVRAISADDKRTFAVAFSPTGETLLTAGSDGWVKLWDVQTYELIAQFHHDDWIYDAKFNSTGELIVSASSDGSVRLWDTLSNESIWIVQIATGEVDEFDFPISPTDVMFSPSEIIIAVAFWNKIKLLDVESGATLHELTGHTDGVDGIAFNPVGTLLASAGNDGTIRLWGVPSEE